MEARWCKTKPMRDRRSAENNLMKYGHYLDGGWTKTGRENTGSDIIVRSGISLRIHGGAAVVGMI